METAEAGETLETLREQARTLSQQRHYDEALAAWHAVEERAPADEEAAGMIATLTIRRGRQRGGLESPASPLFPPALAQPEPMTPAPEQAFAAQRAYDEARGQLPQVDRTPIQQLEVAVREFPSRVELYLQLTPLYLAKGRVFDADRLLTKGLAATGNDVRVRKLWEEVALARLDYEIAETERRVAREDSDEAHEQLAELTARREKVEVEILTARSQREPDNAVHHFDLAVRLRRQGKLREAAQSFAAAAQDSRHEVASLLFAGECLQELGELPEAQQRYRASASAATRHGALGERKKALDKAAAIARSIGLEALAKRYELQ